MAINRSDAPDYYHDMAKDAVKYVKDTIGIVSANKFVDDFVLRLAFGNVPPLICVAAMKEATDDEFKKRNVRAEQQVTAAFEIIAAKAKEYKCGNCREQAAVAFVYLRDHRPTVEPLDLMMFTTVRDHGFLILGIPRALPTDNTSSRSIWKAQPWYQRAALCDPYYGTWGYLKEMDDEYSLAKVSRLWHYEGGLSGL